MGTAGYRALLSRALALANVEVRWLRGVHVRSDGSFEGLEELHSRITPADFFEGRVELVAQMLGLLVAFIGESLTLGLVREAWPAIPLNDLALGNGEKNENTK